MSRRPDTYEVRLTSRRAPYRRAGVVFASTRKSVDIPADDLTDDQLSRLSADPEILIEVIDVATGDVVAFQTEDGTIIGIAPAEGGADSIDAASADAASQAAGSGEGNGGQTGAGATTPAPTTPPAPETPKPPKTRQTKKPA